MPSLEKFWQHDFLGNDVRSWTFALVTFLITLTVLPLVKGFISARRRHWAERDAQLAGSVANAHVGNAHHAIGLATLLVERRACSSFGLSPSISLRAISPSRPVSSGS